MHLNSKVNNIVTTTATRYSINNNAKFNWISGTTSTYVFMLCVVFSTNNTKKQNNATYIADSSASKIWKIFFLYKRRNNFGQTWQYCTIIWTINLRFLDIFCDIKLVKNKTDLTMTTKVCVVLLLAIAMFGGSALAKPGYAHHGYVDYYVSE